MPFKPIHTFLLLLFWSCTPSFVKQTESYSHTVVKETKENDKAKEILNAYKTKVDSETQKVIAFSTDMLTKNGDQNALGNFICDALNFSARKYFSSDEINVVIVNKGGMRSNLPKGEIKVLNIFELMPFDNEMVLLRIKGEKLLEGLKVIIEKKHSFYGIKLNIKNGRFIESSINGSPIEKFKNYTVLTSDYIANGGDNFNFLQNPIEQKTYSIKIRDALIDYCVDLTKNGKQIIPYTDDRFKISE